MAKSQQRSSKETKKPKKDDSAAKPLSPGAVSAPITTVVMNTENDLEHRFGYRNHATPDHSRNLWWTAPFLGWHNTHHHNPSRFSTREKWWEIDLQDVLHPLLALGSPGAWK